MKGDKEVSGILKGYDDYVNMVLEDVTELYVIRPTPNPQPPSPPELTSGRDSICVGVLV